MKHIRLIVAATAFICASAAQASVTQGGVTLTQLTPTPNGIQANYDMHFGDRPASMLINYDTNHQLRFVTTTADANSLMVVAHPGDVITAATLQAQIASAWGSTGPTFSNHPVIGTDFYIAGMVFGGMATEHFGWAHLVADASGTLTVADSAMAYGEFGIIVGTTQAVPEPSSLALMLLGLGFAGLHARRKTMSRN